VSHVLLACGSYQYGAQVYIVHGGADSLVLAARVDKGALLQALAG
jgi:predicted GH43/DUF377 family glycosyl hydrolase